MNCRNPFLFLIYAFATIITIGSCEHEPFEPIVEDLTINTAGIIDTTDTTAIDSSMIPSFSSEVKPIIDGNCTSPYCHGTGASNPNLTNYSDVYAKASRVKDRTAVGGGMPVGGTLTSEQIQIITKWVDGGAPNN